MMDPTTTNFILGGLAGTVSAVSVFPIDLAKTKMQSTQGAEAEKHSTLSRSLSTILKENGPLGLWRGSAPVAFGSAPESAIQLAMHDRLITLSILLFSQSGELDLPWEVQCLAGAIASAATLIVTHPMEVLRIRAATSAVGEGSLAAIRRIGLRGLFSGYQATMLRDIPFGALYFPLYCAAKVHVAHLLAAGGLIASAGEEALLGGLIAGALASGLTAPLDAIMTRVQAATHGATPREAPSAAPAHPRLVASFADSPPDPIRDTVLEMMAQEGARAFLRGASARVAKTAPVMAITLLVYEQLQNLFGVVAASPTYGPFL